MPKFVVKNCEKRELRPQVIFLAAETRSNRFFVLENPYFDTNLDKISNSNFCQEWIWRMNKWTFPFEFGDENFYTDPRQCD